MKNDLAGIGSRGQESPGRDSTGVDRLVSHGEDLQRSAYKGEARRGSEWPGGQGTVRSGVGRSDADRPGKAAKATGAAQAAPTYRIRPGARVPAKDAAALASAMLDLQREGRATAEDLIGAAEPEDSPIHHCFEWNNVAAAHQYRVQQARHYWLAIEVVVRVDDTTEKKQRAFYPVFVGDDRQYRDIGTIVQSDSLMAQLVGQAKRDLIAFKNRYAMIREAPALAPFFAAIDAMHPEGKDAA